VIPNAPRTPESPSSPRATSDTTTSNPRFPRAATASSVGLYRGGGTRPLDEVLLLAVRFAMGKTRRGGFVFVTWVGDHSPYHVHVYRDGTLVVKWDLENHTAVKGEANAKVLKLIKELTDEGKL
jgi:hypothetical protein